MATRNDYLTKILNVKLILKQAIDQYENLASEVNGKGYSNSFREQTLSSAFLGLRGLHALLSPIVAPPEAAEAHQRLMTLGFLWDEAILGVINARTTPFLIRPWNAVSDAERQFDSVLRQLDEAFQQAFESCPYEPLPPGESRSISVSVRLDEWLSGEGAQLLSRLLSEGGQGNFAIASFEQYFVQFAGGRGDLTLHVEAVSNSYLPPTQHLAHAQIAALQAAGFLLDPQIGNFVLNANPDESFAAQVAGTVLREVYGVPLDAALKVELTFE
jgi:hypothetical protein